MQYKIGQKKDRRFVN